MAEANFEHSAYSYVQNNPLLYIDLLGLDTLNATIDEIVIIGYVPKKETSWFYDFRVSVGEFLNPLQDHPYFGSRPYDAVDYYRTINAARDPALDLIEFASFASGVGEGIVAARVGMLMVKKGLPLILKRLALRKATKTGSQLLLKPGAANLTQKGLDHIVARHWFTSGAKGAGKFAEGTIGAGLKGMINTTTTHGAFRANTMGRAGTIAEYNFGTVIGTTSSGAPASSLRIDIGTNGNVITAFPF